MLKTYIFNSVIFSGRRTLSSIVQDENAEAPISVTPSGNVTDTRDVQPQNAPLFIFVIPSGTTRSVTSPPLRYSL